MRLPLKLERVIPKDRPSAYWLRDTARHRPSRCTHIYHLNLMGQYYFCLNSKKYIGLFRVKNISVREKER